MTSPETKSIPLHWALLVLGLLSVVLLVPVTLDAVGELGRLRQLEAAVSEHRARARAALSAGDFDQAEQALAAARSLAPGHVDLQRESMRIDLLRVAAAPHALQDERLDELVYALTVVREELPPATALVVQGHLAARRGAPAAAKAAFEQALQVDERHVPALLALGKLHRAEGRSLEALAAYEAAVAAGPQEVSALNELGVHYLRLERAEDALAMFERASAVRDNAASRLNAAEALSKLERRVEAIEHLRQAIKLAPGAAEAYGRLGALLALEGRHAEAEELLLASLKLRQDPVITLNLGIVHQLMGRHERAAEEFLQVRRASPSSTEAAYRLGVSLQALGRGAEAAAVLQDYLQLAEGVQGEQKRAAEVRTALGALDQQREQRVTPGADVTQ